MSVLFMFERDNNVPVHTEYRGTQRNYCTAPFQSWKALFLIAVLPGIDA